MRRRWGEEGVIRVVVSGPETFNSAVKGMLVEIGVSTDAITVLSA